MSDKTPLCPDCGNQLYWESPGDRDTETIDGNDVEYFVCDNGCGQFEVIEGGIYPLDNPI